MTRFTPSNIIEDNVGRFDATERADMRRLGFKVVPATSYSIADVAKEVRRLSERITQIDGMKNLSDLQQMAAQRSQLTMQLPEIGF